MCWNTGPRLLVCQHSGTVAAMAVRTVADRGFVPLKNLLEEVGDMMILTGKTIVSAIRPPYPYGGEFMGQFLFALKLCWFPLLVSMVAAGYGAPGLQAANILTLFGTIDRLGGFFVLASIREFAPLITAIIVAGRGRHRDHRRPRRAQGARGARRAAGARRRPGEEPRGPALPRPHAAHGPVRHLRADLRRLRRGAGDAHERRAARAVLGDLLHERVDHRPVGSVLKCTGFGAIVAVVCCYKGMTASGGAEGVGRAVNQAVVISLMGVCAFNYVFTQTLLATHPEIQVLR
jgi:phospholipid/cholesterol/gamma-HCH transport system permease protein